MNVYKRELRANRRSLIFWCIGLLLFIAASMGKYSALSKDPASLGIFDQLPMGLQAVFGVSSFDFLKALGFFGMIFPYLILMAAIHASMLGAGILSKEERDRTSEFLYVKPATRSRILTAKLVAALTCVVLLNLVTWALSAALVGKFAVAGEPVSEGVARLMIGLLCVQLLFLALGFAAAAILKHPKAAAGIATGVMLATYILSIAIDVNGSLSGLKGFTPFEYFDAKLIIGHETGNVLAQGLNGGYVALALALTAVFITAAYVFFQKRDLKV